MINEEQTAIQNNFGGRLPALDAGFDNEPIDLHDLERFITDELSFEDVTNGHGPGYTGDTEAVSYPCTPVRQSMPQSSVIGGAVCNPPLQTMAHAHLGSQQARPQLNGTMAHHSQLPDSPPDSGSEPYSPPDGQQGETTYNVNAKLHVASVSSMAGLHAGMSAHAHVYPMPGVHLPQPAATSSPPHAHASPPQQNMPAHLRPTLYNGAAEPPKLSHADVTSTMTGPVPPQLSSSVNPALAGSPHYSMQGLVQPASKKRRISDSPNSSLTPSALPPAVLAGLNTMSGMPPGLGIKQEPGMMGTGGDCGDFDDYYDPTDSAPMTILDGNYQVIKWSAFRPESWAKLCDETGKELPQITYRVDADKGFNFSLPDDSFVCQKKNHFQVTVHVGVQGSPRVVKAGDCSYNVDAFFLSFQGVKMEAQTQAIKVEQSQSDRSKKPFKPVRVELPHDQVTKVTVGRLHFSETTTNNMRKKGKPNPDQRYFMLVVTLEAQCGDRKFVIASQSSERIIVRASNPGQFESDVDVLWQKGVTPESVVHAGRVGVNTERPDEALTVHGNVHITGHIIQPSDRRAKINIQEIDPKEQLDNLKKLKVYKYQYQDGFAEHAGLSEDELDDTGVIAQEVRDVIPDAVRETGDIFLPDGNKIDNFLVVDKDRIYMENIGAVKELCKVTDTLEGRIDEMERLNRRLVKCKRVDSMKSTTSVRSLSTCSTISSQWSKSRDSDKANNNTSSTDKQHRDHKHSRPRRDHHDDKHKCGRQQSRPEKDSALCSNRFIQVTVIVLVLVMAFCLVSITTLYILEKNKPHGGGDRQKTEKSTTPFPPSTRSGNASRPGTGHKHTAPPGVGPPPLMHPRCMRPGVHCDMYCCPGPPQDDDTDMHGTVRPGKPRPGLPQGVEPESGHVGYTVVPSDKRGQKGARGPPGRQRATLHVTVRPGRGAPQERAFTYNVPADPSQNSHDKESPPVVIGHSHVVSLPDQQGAPRDGPLDRRRRDVHTSDNGQLQPAKLFVHQANQSMGTLYCQNEDCRQGLGHNSSYAVPLHWTFPFVYIGIRFQIPDNQRVTICGENKQHKCTGNARVGQPVSGVLQTNWMAHNTVDLPVGYYFSSKYKFRVSFVTQRTQSVCHKPASGLGKEFFEYNFHFYKVCPSHS